MEREELAVAESTEATTAELTIDRWVPGGLGLAHHDGKTWLVKGALPGERVRAQVKSARGDVRRAVVEEVLEASPDRLALPWEGDDVRNGWDFQHIAYPAQLAAKRAIVMDAFRRTGGIMLGEGFNILPSPKQFRYRTRATWHLDPMTGAFGYMAAESHRVVDVEECPIVEPALNEALTKTRESIRAGLTAALVYRAAAGDTTAAAFSGVGDPPYLWRNVGGYRYRFDPTSFFQANGSLLEALVDEALWLANDLNGDGSGIALDFYSGVGLFTLPLGAKFEKVIGIESDANAVKHARRNAHSNDAETVSFMSMPTDRFFREQKKLARSARFALMDPPRTGLDPKTRAGLIDAAIPNLTYVSCDPTTLARDLKALLANGYELVRVQGLDCFPQTHHVEVVAHLRMP
jgi:tRNA/tmRNA/rRNA uracil-C5-methylase (TrmA/RlmC/RlmD family)